MTQHHVIISGVGRSGTTFLVQLLSQLGLDTGFIDNYQVVDDHCKAGLELDLRDLDAPYIIKNPWLCDYLSDVLLKGNVVIDHAIIPMRDLFSCAESRRFVTKTANSNDELDQIPGGLWHTKDPFDQETILVNEFYNLFFTLTKYDIPVTLLEFPRLAIDPEYLYKKLFFILKEPVGSSLSLEAKSFINVNNISYNTFLAAFKLTSKPELIHKFIN